MLAQASKYEQGTYEWLKERIPFVTASCISDVMTKGQGKTRNTYMVKKVCEILSGEPTKGFKSKYMQAGNDNEETARQLYAAITGTEVKQMPFYFIKEESLGASSDGEVSQDGIIEIKNVVPSEQIDFILTGKIKDGYVKQMQAQMYVLEKKWCDFVSVSLGDEEHGELPDKYKVKIKRVMRDDDLILSIRKEVSFFNADLKQMIDKLSLQ